MLVDVEFFEKSKNNTFAVWKERYDRLANNLDYSLNFFNILECIYGQTSVEEFKRRYGINI